MGLQSNERRGFTSPMMKIGDTLCLPDDRPRTAKPEMIRRSSKRLISSADFQVSNQRIRTSIGCRQFSKFNYANNRKNNQICHVSFKNTQDIHSYEDEDNESEDWCNIRRRLSSKDIVHHLLEEWVPQLCENYRPFVYYQEPDDTMSVITMASERSDKNSVKMNAVENGAETSRRSQNGDYSVDVHVGVG